MMQGDEYNIPIEIELSNGLAKPSDFLEVEIVVAGIRKTMRSGEVKYDEERKLFLFPITQKESFMLTGFNKDAQVRVKLKNGQVIGQPLGTVDFLNSVSRTVI